MDISNIIKKILDFDYGKFHASAGVHEIFVPTEVVPKTEPWVRIHGKGTEGCCIPPINSVATTLKPDGIVFYLEINTTHGAVIEWAVNIDWNGI